MKPQKLLAIMGMFIACIALSFAFTSCGDDDDNTIDPSYGAWICGTWSATLDATKYENDQPYDNHKTNVNNIVFKEDGTMSGLNDYDRWSLVDNRLTFVNSTNLQYSQVNTISWNPDYSSFTFTYRSNTNVTDDGRRLYYVCVYTFHRNK